MVTVSQTISYLRAKKLFFINGAIIAVVIIAAIAGRMSKGDGGVAGETTQPPRVHLLSAADFRADRTTVLASGIIESNAQVEVKAQTSAPVARVLVKLGDTVRTGQTLIILENSDQAAGLMQARAALDVQKARFQEVVRGARKEERTIAEKGYEQAATALLNQQKGIIELLSDAYAKTEDAIRSKSDPIFINDDTTLVQFSFMVTDAQSEADAKEARVSMTRMLAEWERELSTLTTEISTDTLEEALTHAISHVRAAGDYFAVIEDTLANPAGISSATVDAYKMNVNMGRITVTGLASHLTSYERALESQTIALARMREEVKLIETGATPEQIAMQEALVKQAEAGVAGASAQYEKTIIRATLNGQIAVLPMTLGDLASFGSPLISIVNTEGLKVKAFISSEDAFLVDIGAEALVNGTIPAMVAERSPSINPLTKKVEVIIFIPIAPKDLLVGESVDLRITPPAAQESKNGNYLIPIQAVQVSPQGAYVYTISDTFEARALPVDIGTTAGEFVEVLKGLEDTMRLIGTVQDLKDGDKVEIDNESKLQTPSTK